MELTGCTRGKTRGKGGALGKTEVEGGALDWHVKGGHALPSLRLGLEPNDFFLPNDPFPIVLLDLKAETRDKM